jgi:hypothetical protein
MRRMRRASGRSSQVIPVDGNLGEFCRGSRAIRQCGLACRGKTCPIQYRFRQDVVEVSVDQRRLIGED